MVFVDMGYVGKMVTGNLTFSEKLTLQLVGQEKIRGQLAYLHVPLRVITPLYIAGGMEHKVI